MLVSFAELLREQQKAAVGAFTCYNFEAAAGVLQAASAQGRGVLLLVSEQSFRAAHGASLVAALQAMAAQALVPACVQLDHVRDLTLINAAFALGVGAVMADGSQLPFEQNIAFVRAAVEIARFNGGGIEAELGRVEGNEDSASATLVGTLTDPAQAVRFVAQAEPTCLAVSIGNVHGIYQRPPELDWTRLAQIRAQISIPLSLHGASGLPESDLRHAIALGIRKINVNTELRSRYLEVVAAQLPRVQEGARVFALQEALTEAMAQVASEKLRVYELEGA